MQCILFVQHVSYAVPPLYVVTHRSTCQHHPTSTSHFTMSATSVVYTFVKRLRRALDKATQVLNATDTTHFPLRREHQLQDQLACIVLTLDAIGSQPTPPLGQEFDTEYTLFMTSLTTFISSLVTRLEELDAACTSPCQSAQFTACWGVLGAGCLAANMWDCLNFRVTARHLQSPAQTYAAVHKLLSWLATTLHSSSGNWLSLHNRPKDLLTEEVAQVLSVPLMCIDHSLAMPYSEAFTELCTLPDGFIPLLCSLLYDLLGVVESGTEAAARPESSDAINSGVSSSVHKPSVITAAANSIANIVGLANVIGRHLT